VLVLSRSRSFARVFRIFVFLSNGALHNKWQVHDAETKRKRAAKTFAQKHPDAANVFAAQQSPTITAGVYAPGTAPSSGLLALYASDMPHFDNLVSPAGPPPAQRRRVGENPVMWVAKPSSTRICTDVEQRKFKADFVRLLVVMNIAFHAVEHPFFRLFCAAYLDGFIIPGRKQLSGRILDDVTTTAIETIRERKHARYMTGQSDGFKNVSKDATIGSIANVEGTVSIFVACMLQILTNS
jgi:hypothetical protein